MIHELLHAGEVVSDRLETGQAVRRYKRINRRPGRQAIVRTYDLTREQKQEIDEFFVKNYGRKIPYDWHRYYAAHSGVFDAKFFPEILFHAYFERFMNPEDSYNRVLSDKNFLPYVAQAVGVSMPRTVVSFSKGLYRDGEGNMLDRDSTFGILKNGGKLFCKPSRGSCGGHGCLFMDFGGTEDVDAVLEGLGREFVIQETVRCAPSIQALYPDAVNTFRVVSYRWKDGFYTMPCVMRIAHGGAVVDNASSGGMFVSVSDDGCLKGNAVTMDNRHFSAHPDTHTVFDGHRIDGFEKVREAAIRLHTLLPPVGVIGWDLTLDEKGEPLLIEANIMRVIYYFCQMTLGIPAFGDRTAEVLQWIRKMKRVPYDKRGEYAFGN